MHFGTIEIISTYYFLYILAKGQGTTFVDACYNIRTQRSHPDYTLYNPATAVVNVDCP